MPAALQDLGQVLSRLNRVLPERASELWEARRSPVSEADLDGLRRAVEPNEVPEDVVAMLRWADGYDHGGPWWPSLEAGPLLSAARAAEHYAWLCENTEEWQWSRAWLPIAHEGWYQVGVEMTNERPGVVIDGSFPDRSFVAAPSLAAALDVTAQMLEAGVALRPPQDAEGIRRWKAERVALIEAREEWRVWPHDRVIANDVALWPAHWRPPAST